MVALTTAFSFSTFIECLPAGSTRVLALPEHRLFRAGAVEEGGRRGCELREYRREEHSR